MTRYTKNANGMYMIHGHKYEMLEGSRAQVMHGTAYKTSGGLKKTDLVQNKNGRIVSKKKHHSAKKDNRLVKAGFGTKKGHFGAVKLGASRKTRHRSKKMRGGSDPVPAAPYVSGAYQAAPFGGKRRGHKKSRRGGAGLTDMVNSMGKMMGEAIPMPINLASMPN